jgi:thiamine-monophosphate kinase
MIDTSDGFLGDLGHICEESGVGAELFKEKIPVSENLRKAALMLQRDPYDFFLGESDDYELVITCRSQDVALLRSTVSQCSPVPLSEVGRITGATHEIMLLFPSGERRALKPLSWDHFR